MNVEAEIELIYTRLDKIAEILSGSKSQTDRIDGLWRILCDTTMRIDRIDCDGSSQADYDRRSRALAETSFGDLPASLGVKIHSLISANLDALRIQRLSDRDWTIDFQPESGNFYVAYGETLEKALDATIAGIKEEQEKPDAD